jgi:2-hydroxy-3-keto-5-methylthiopentenyl-1-phosphate phosphatase
MTAPRLVLQLDFDGTLTEVGVTEAIMERFLGPEWTQQIEAASRVLHGDPSSPALLDALKAAARHLIASEPECVAYALQHAPPRRGIDEMIATAERLGFECHVVSYGLDFYVKHYLRSVLNDVSIHCGETQRDKDGLQVQYRGPDGHPLTASWKQTWIDHFLGLGAEVVYAGDGSSDIAPAQSAATVFARDALLRGMPPSYAGRLLPFETLHDISRGLEEVYS